MTELLPGRVALAVRAQVESIGTSRMSQPDQWLLSNVEKGCRRGSSRIRR
ncbi:hypothetical protein ACFYO7_14180 [Nocardia salmonicida]